MPHYEHPMVYMWGEEQNKEIALDSYIISNINIFKLKFDVLDVHNTCFYSMFEKALFSFHNLYFHVAT